MIELLTKFLETLRTTDYSFTTQNFIFVAVVTISILIVLQLNMQIFLHWCFEIYTVIYITFTDILDNTIAFLKKFGLTKAPEVNGNIIFDETNNMIKPEDYIFSFLFETVIEISYIAKWILFPIFLYFSFIYMLHAILGLYSVYVDYFQKNPLHMSTLRALLPGMFIFYLIMFIFSSLFFFALILYLHHILWFLFL
jgi:hypothetical protein